MPIFEYLCESCGRRDEEILLVGEQRPAVRACSRCGGRAPYVPSSVSLDFNSPTYRQIEADGKLIREPGFKRDVKRAREYRQEKVRKQVEQICEDVVREVPGLPAD